MNLKSKLAEASEGNKTQSEEPRGTDIEFHHPTDEPMEDEPSEIDRVRAELVIEKQAREDATQAYIKSNEEVISLRQKWALRSLGKHSYTHLVGDSQTKFLFSSSPARRQYTNKTRVFSIRQSDYCSRSGYMYGNAVKVKTKKKHSRATWLKSWSTSSSLRNYAKIRTQTSRTCNKRSAVSIICGGQMRVGVYFPFSGTKTQIVKWPPLNSQTLCKKSDKQLKNKNPISFSHDDNARYEDQSTIASDLSIHKTYIKNRG